MSSPGVTSCLLLLLLLAAVHSASVGGQSEQAAGTLSAAAPDPSVSRTTANATEENGDDIIRIGIPKLSEKAEKSKLNKSEMDDDEDEGKEEEAAENEEKEEEEEEEEEQEDEGDYEEAYEGEDDDDEDEYEDELKTIAESHEAMSKDEATSRNASSAGNERPEGKLSNARNFDSHERSSKDTFDEDTTSNEAFTDDVIEKAQTKVVELLKQYKHKLGKNTRTKVKRMPTVKKELSTQKEILLAANETQVPKSLLPSEDPHNRLSGKTDSVQRRSLERSEAQEEVTLAKSLLKFLVKLAEDPNGWQCIHKMLANVENDLQASRNIQDPVKRGYDTTATLSSTMPPTSKAPRKGPKKPRKKKKRPRHRQTPSTTVGFTATTTPETSPLLTTTEAQSTTPHWRLVAERLFSPPWQSKVHEKSKNVAKVRYGIASKPRAPVWELQDKIDQQDKPKNILRTMSNERAPLLLDFPREVSGQSRSMRFGKVNTYQPLRLQDSREFTSMSYDRPADPDRSADYYLPEATYSRLRYGPSHEFSHRRSENDYQDDLSLRTDNFAYNQEYRPTSREFASSKSWSNPSYKSRPWDEQAVLVSSEKWPWRQHGDFKYWPERGKYSDRNYWMTMRSGEEGDDRINPPTEMDEEWQQQRLPLWREASKSGGWSMGKNLKPPQHLWPQADMSVKPYDQSRTAWEKSKNHSELDKKENVDNKVVLPKITMKTWNSLTSDPATWPYKLPSAKPWPKDENGKSYNPNADLVKKLGLDKENDDARSKEKDERTGRLVFEKQIDSDHPSSKEASKKKEILLGEPKYKPMDNRSNYSDYRPRNSESQESTKERPNWAYQDVKQSKDWNKPLLASNVLRNGEANSWSHKFETPTGNQAKTVSPNDDNFSFSHFWPANAGGEQNWTDKKGESSAESWKDNDKEISSPKVKPHNGLNFWKEKSNNSWLPKAKTDLWRSRMKSAPTSWTSKMGENNSWTTKVDNGWMLKPNKADSWTTNANIWEKSHSADSWPRSSGELTAWKDKNLVMHNAWSKSNSGDWSQKTKDNNSWVNSFNNMATWKSNEDNWSRKPEQSVWQQKMNDDWNIDYGKSSASTWPTRWKQFAYHKVTAMPISKPRTAADVSSKSKNAFVAVSAVSSANYNGGNDWRKGDVEEAIREDNFRLDEMERGGNQIRPERVERPIYAWKKDGSELNNGGRVKNNGTDALENQLESLKQDYWSFKENKIEVDEESTYGRTSTTTQTAMVTKLSTTSQSPKSPRTLPAPKDVEERPEIYQQSLMK